MRRKTFQVVIACLFVTAAWNTKVSAAVTIDFEDYAIRGITPVANVPGFVAVGPTGAGGGLSNQYLNDDGVVFSSTLPYVAVVSGAAFGAGSIGGVASSTVLSYVDPVDITFFVPGTNTPGVTDSVSIQGDPIGIPSQTATLTAFDINGNQIDSETLFDTGSEIWTLTDSGIHSVEFLFPGTNFGYGTGIALDNLNFGDVTSAATTTPEPSSLIVWGGLCAIGLLFARRQFANC